MGWYFGDAVRSMGTTIRNAFRAPTTVQFPKEKRERAERFRTSFALLHDSEGDELCVGCLQCERICPSQVITVVAEKKESPITGKRRGYATDFVLDLNACIFCELCVQVCPTDAIVMTRVPETPGYSREELCLTMDRLYENEKAKPASWATASLLMAMQDPKRGQPDAKAAKKAARAEAKAAAKPTARPEADAKPGAGGKTAGRTEDSQSAEAEPKTDVKPQAADRPAAAAKTPADGKRPAAKPVDPTPATSSETPDSKTAEPGPRAAATTEDRTE